MPFLTKGPEGKQASYGVNKTNWKPRTNSSGIIRGKYILIVLILALIVGGGILSYVKYLEREMVSITKFPEVKKPEKVEEETANWRTYRNEELGFEVKYPQQWTFKEQKMPAKGVTFGEEKKVEPPTVKGAIEESVFTPIVAFNFYSNVCEIEGNVPCRPLEEYLNWFASLIKSVKKEEATVEPIVFGANNYKGFALKEGGDVTGIYYQQKEAILEAFKVSAELKYNGNIFNQMLSTFTLY